MRVASWNLWWRFGDQWAERQRRILKQLRAASPDVIGLQEVWATDRISQADVIADALGMEAVFAAPSLPPVPVPPETPDQEGVDLGVAVVSRWPVVASRRYSLPSTHRSFEPVVLMVTLDHPAGPLHVFTTATEWEPSFADDHLAQTRRLAELVSDPALEGPLPVLLAADLNATPDAPELRPLLAVMTDTWTVGGGDTHARTLRSEHPFAPSEATKQLDQRIDYVLARSTGDDTVEVARASTLAQPVDGLHPSDHDAVIVDLELTD